MSIAAALAQKRSEKYSADGVLIALGFERARACARWIKASASPACTSCLTDELLEAMRWRTAPAISSSAICSTGSAMPWRCRGWNMRQRIAAPAAADKKTLGKGIQTWPKGKLNLGMQLHRTFSGSSWGAPCAYRNNGRSEIVERGEFICRHASRSRVWPNSIMAFAFTARRKPSRQRRPSERPELGTRRGGVQGIQMPLAAPSLPSQWGAPESAVSELSSNDACSA